MTSAGPLEGVTILDLTRVLAGPFCTMMLAELGARVIKVERPGQGDDARRFGPFQGQRSAYFMSLNRGKESIALDLKDEAHREIFEALLERADVLVENYRPGTMERLGYGWEQLHRRYPRLIYAAISGFGQTGPRARRPAYDLVVQAMGGLMSITGHPGQPPTRVGSSVGDITAALFASNGILAALFHRQRAAEAGEAAPGMQIDISMLDAQVAILENAIARYAATGQSPQPLGARHPSITPFDAFATQDRHIVIAAGNDELFGRLCETLERTDLRGDPRFADNPSRTAHADALKAELEAHLSQHPSSHWLQRLEDAGIPCGPIQDLEALLQDPQLQHRQMFVTAQDPRAGAVTMAGNPIKMSAFPDPTTRSPAPELDAQRDAILEELQRN